MESKEDVRECKAFEKDFELDFSQGRRDGSLFHVANRLAKGGCSYNNTNIKYIISVMSGLLVNKIK
jgi:hypothetical protein